MNNHQSRRPAANPLFHRAPIARAVLLMAAAAAQPALAQQAFSPAWFAAKGAVQQSAATTGYLPNGMPVSALTNPAQQQQQANATLQRSINNLSQLARGIAAQQAAQEAARQAAIANGASVPDGLGEGGLKVDTNSLTQGWANAQAASQNVSNGKTTVTIQQTADKAILNWETFNVGKNTLVDFRQDPSWAVLNRVNDPAARPSVIQGQIAGNGTVMIVNRNGIVFTGSSQIDVRNLVAAAATLTDIQFRTAGLYGANGTTPSFTDASGQLIVQAGARLNTTAPDTVTQGGGYILLMGSEVSNAGLVSTPKGQTQLAAGDSFIIRKGVATDANITSTTAGNEIAPQVRAGSSAGRVVNQGMLTAPEGDVTLAGRSVLQNGVALASTTVNARGTVHLLNAASDTQGSVTLGPQAFTAVLIDDDGKTTALNSQRDALIADSATKNTLRAASAVFDNLSLQADRRDQSRIEIVSGGNIDFQAGSLTLATGGQVSTSATRRSYVASGALLDVSGAVGVALPMSSNGLLVNVQGNELRDAALARDSGKLANSNLWIDTRNLVFVAAGTGGYTADRWYTAGGLLEVGGYLANQGHRISEWAAQGGSLLLGGKEVVTQAGSSINLSGGSLNVDSGYLGVSWLRGSDGQLYRADLAPADLAYSGNFRGFEVAHPRWGDSATETFGNAWIAPQRILQNGYTVGRDAGRMLVNAPTAVLEGEIVAAVYNGPAQVNARAAGASDGYQATQTSVARAGALSLGQFSAMGHAGTYATSVLVGDVAQLSPGLGAATALPATRSNTAWLDAGWLNALQLGGLEVVTAGSIVIDRALTLADGGALSLISPNIDFRASIVARGGSVSTTNLLTLDGTNTVSELLRSGRAQVALRTGATIDVRGVWVDPSHDAGRAWINGGNVGLAASGEVLLETGSLIDVSSGAALLPNHATLGGKGGNVSLLADTRSLARPGSLTLDGALRAYGVKGGGVLVVDSGNTIAIAMAGAAASLDADVLRIDPALLRSGFSDYRISGHRGLQVVPGTVLEVSMPVYRLTDQGNDGAGSLALWTPPVYTDNAAKAMLTRRAGASLTLNAGRTLSSEADMARTVLDIGRGASITVDPGQAITLGGIGQVNVDGSLTAWGGKITVGGINIRDEAPGDGNAGRSIWIGEHAVLDVAGRATTALDAMGRRYGVVQAGGDIVIGGALDTESGKAAAPNLFVVVRDGAVLDASGTAASLDLATGTTKVASNGGSISFSSNNGLILGGTWRAASGGAGAAGGTLSAALESAIYFNTGVSPQVLQLREFMLSQQRDVDPLAGVANAKDAVGRLVYGRGALSVAQVEAGGFGQLNVLSQGAISFAGDVTMTMPQGLNLFSTSLDLADTAAANSRVSLAAPYLRLAGTGERIATDGRVTPVAYRSALSARTSQAQFSASAALLDLQRTLMFGTNGSVAGVRNDRRGFDQVTLTSSGDLRFLSSMPYDGLPIRLTTNELTTMMSRGDIDFAARQLYPVLSAVASVTAGWSPDSTLNNLDSTRSLNIRSTGAAPEAMPYTAFGSLNLVAGTINQGGTLRAPLGTLTFGTLYGTRAVNFLPGSITSTSSDGLTMPFGGTIDGVDWRYRGNALTLESVLSDTRGINVNSQRFNVNAGALVDLSGGGTLTGAGFVSGRGGSIDILRYPLLAANPTNTGSASSNQVYAIVPSVGNAYAPWGVAGDTANPQVGQQITITTAVGGLAAGTYTLMPASFALLPGAFRVEVPTTANLHGTASTGALRGGAYAASARLGVANVNVQDSLARQVILTPADVVRHLAQYDETGYARFVMADAARLGVPRAMLPADGKNLAMQFAHGGGADTFAFDGTIDFLGASGGVAGSASIFGNFGDSVEVLAAGAAPTAGFDGVSLYAAQLNALSASRLVIGGKPMVKYGQSGNYVMFPQAVNSARDIVLREGAVLRAAEVLLLSGWKSLTSSATGAITLEAGAGINTLGMGAAPFDSLPGFVYSPESDSTRGAALLAVSNGRLTILPASASVTSQGAILLGACGAGNHCAAPTTLYSEGTIAFATNNRFELGDNVAYGTRDLSFNVGAVNIGSNAALATASAAGVLPSGLMLNQTVLDRLLRGDTSVGAPALERLSLNASQAVNLFGTVALDTYDANGHSRIDTLVLGSPALYGLGGAADVASIRTRELVWQGATTAPGTVITGGAGTGSGTLQVSADRITLGAGASTLVNGIDDAARLALGFANVTFNANERFSASQKGSLAVYQQQGAYVSGSGYSYTGGNLNIVTPLVTGAAGSSSTIKAGGAIALTAPSSAGAPMVVSASEALGASLALQAQTISLATSVVLPSGRLSVNAQGDVNLTSGAQIDVAGRAVVMNDTTQYSWGGDVILESLGGNIRQAAGSRIDLSAQFNKAGQLTVAALGTQAGLVDLQGSIVGTASGEYDAGGTYVPFRRGSIDLRAQHLGGAGALTDQFAALNTRLNAGGVDGARSFQFKQGDLVIGNGVRAGEVSVSIDAGRLDVTGTIDASGAEVGVIRLSARDGLTIAGSALLDAHGRRLRVDSTGQIIDSPNRAVVELNSGNGRLVLASGARIDLRHGTSVPVGSAPGRNDGAARGTLELNAPRLVSATAGDVDIDVAGSIVISGARVIAVNAVQRYSDAAYGTDATASGRPYQVIDQAYLNAKHGESVDFITHALNNAALMDGKLAGLNNAGYRNAFHLRPGVEIVSATPDGDLVVPGDLDLSGYRYGGVNPNFVKTSGVAGSGEVGALVMRAGGNLSIYGSITDGFAPPPVTPDDDGWLLRPGVLSYGGDVVVPSANVTLAGGTTYPAGRALNYDLKIRAMTVPVGTRLPVASVLSAPLALAANTIVAADVTAADGSLLYAAGTRLVSDVSLPANTRLGAGFVVSGAAALQAMTWPRDVALPTSAVLDGDLTLPMGALIPARTSLVLPGNALSVSLRPVDGAGNQGANWAVASMLPAGTQSWSMRLVAGADTTAADTRMVRPRDANGNLTLADTHFSVFDQHQLTVIPGTPAQHAGAWYWSEEGAANLGETAGTPIDPAWDPDNVCSDLPGWCTRVEYLWNQDGVLLDPTFLPGTPVLGEWTGFCPDLCTPLGAEIPATPSQTIVGALIGRQPASPIFSVVRTGTGDLDLVAGGNIAMRSAYGVYTAGTQSPGVTSTFNTARTNTGTTVLGSGTTGYETLVSGAGRLYQAWYPTLGGNVLLSAGGTLTGDAWTTSSPAATETHRNTLKSSTDPTNWLWRQGDVAGSRNGAAWWINFGTYVRGSAPDAAYALDAMPYLVGFTGYGTLGGGDLRVQVGGNAGALDVLSPAIQTGLFPRSQAVTLAVASTGRVNADGSVALTGGGDMDVRIGGTLNANAAALTIGSELTQAQNLGLNGVIANLRGHTDLVAASQGVIQLLYGNVLALQDAREVRAFDAFTSTRGLASGGMMLVPGDATFNLAARGDLVLGGVYDATRKNGIDLANAQTNAWFSLWRDGTSIDLFAAGGNLVPSLQVAVPGSTNSPQADAGATAGRFVYPAILRAVAPAGSIYAGGSIARQPDEQVLAVSLTLAPSPQGQLDLLAGQSIYTGGYAITRSGADTAVIPTPLRPATLDNLDPLTFAMAGNLFAFGPNTASGLTDLAPARFYAVAGDVVGLRTGEIVRGFGPGVLLGRTFYEGGGPVWIKAGRDIVNSGTALSTFTYLPGGVPSGVSTGNLIVHANATDVSVVSAGRDILYSSFSVAGPGTLEVSAGRNLMMGERASLLSIGPIAQGDLRPGASILLQAGVGKAGPDYAAMINRYLDPAAIAASQGKAVKTYGAELVDWLAQRFGFAGTPVEALAVLRTLDVQQQAIFLQQVYFAELREGGRDYNDPASPRYLSYVRGRDAIATLFPQRDAQGNAIARQGDITLYGGAGVHTDFGGDIRMLAPAGQVLVGVEGSVPPASAGLITQGSGDIAIYAQDSLRLGLSRIMTTFGGSIMAWSAQGDINAGRGAKTTVLYTPPKRVYDNVGNVTLAPQVPSSGAGIATLAPIPEVPAGDVDLIAPLGTIDAGEAGIRVSGNVNIAALQVVNAANIQVQGKSTGLPVVAAVNVGALTNASAAASSAAMAAQDMNSRERAAARQALPSVFTVRVLGFGDSAQAPSGDGTASSAMLPAASRLPVQVIGLGEHVGAGQRARLTDSERRALDAAR